MSTLTLFAVLVTMGLFLSLANVADRERSLRWVVATLLALIDLGMLMSGVGLALAGLSLGQGVDRGPIVLPDMGSLDAATVEHMFPPALGLSIMVLALLALALLLPPVRRALAFLLPIDPQRNVHTVALHFVLWLTALSAMMAVVMPVLASSKAGLEEIARLAAEGGLVALWVQALGFIVMALLGVGLFVQRGWRPALDRLGLLRRFHVRWWLLATALGLASSYAVDVVWHLMQPQNQFEIERLSEALFGWVFGYGVLGALTVGLSAGLGEEILFRGAAQPRLGLLLTSLTFMVIHVQYTVSLALAQMFFMGLLLGVVRLRVGTTTSIGVHATYNFLLVLLAIYAPNWSP